MTEWVTVKGRRLCQEETETEETQTKKAVKEFMKEKNALGPGPEL